MRSSYGTVTQILKSLAERDDVPPQLLFWLEHAPGNLCWIEAPRPDWLVYLARIEGFDQQLLLRMTPVAERALSTVRRKGVKDDDGEELQTEATPLSQGAATIRQMILDAR